MHVHYFNFPRKKTAKYNFILRWNGLGFKIACFCEWKYELCLSGWALLDVQKIGKEVPHIFGDTPQSVIDDVCVIYGRFIESWTLVEYVFGTLKLQSKFQIRITIVGTAEVFVSSSTWSKHPFVRPPEPWAKLGCQVSNPKSMNHLPCCRPLADEKRSVNGRAFLLFFISQ